MVRNLRTPPKSETWRQDFKDWGVLASSASQRNAVFARDGGKCWDCKQITPDWQADHDLGLHNIPISTPYPQILKYWSLSNLVCRCYPCHLLKTNAEAGARAKTKRLFNKANGLDDKWKKKMASRTFKPVPKKLPKSVKKLFKSRHGPVKCYLNIK